MLQVDEEPTHCGRDWRRPVAHEGTFEKHVRPTRLAIVEQVSASVRSVVRALERLGPEGRTNAAARRGLLVVGEQQSERVADVFDDVKGSVAHDARGARAAPQDVFDGACLS